jgi:2-keto-4-pentenoate hydratase/2-oxohepta-3-ene-1,7-dioic acid hydratase in catechol pathway
VAATRFVRIACNHEIHHALQAEKTYQVITATPWEDWKATGSPVPVQEARLLAPVVPGKIIAIGLNYRSHALEMGMDLPQAPLLFLKPPTALADPGQDITWPPASERVDYEGELALVMGRKAKNITIEKAMESVLGFTLANDITARDLQKKDGQWTRAKGFDGFCPLGPAILTQLDWENFEFQTSVNEIPVQVGKISDLIFSLSEIVAFVSEVMTLFPGDVILTGTPPGIGPLKSGDRVAVAAAQIGKLENRVIRP